MCGTGRGSHGRGPNRVERVERVARRLHCRRAPRALQRRTDRGAAPAAPLPAAAQAVQLAEAERRAPEPGEVPYHPEQRVAPRQPARPRGRPAQHVSCASGALQARL